MLIWFLVPYYLTIYIVYNNQFMFTTRFPTTTTHAPVRSAFTLIPGNNALREVYRSQGHSFDDVAKHRHLCIQTSDGDRSSRNPENPLILSQPVPTFTSNSKFCHRSRALPVRKCRRRAGEVIKWLWALAALGKDRSVVPSTHTGCFTAACKSRPGASNAAFWPCWHSHTGGINSRHTEIHINKNKYNFLRKKRQCHMNWTILCFSICFLSMGIMSRVHMCQYSPLIDSF